MSIVVSDVIIYQYYKNIGLQKFTESKTEELGVIAMAASELIARRNHEGLQHLIAEWGHGHEDIVVLQVADPDGSVLAEYRRGSPADQSVLVAWKGVSAYPDQVRPSMQVDLQKLGDDLNMFLLQICVVSMEIAIIIIILISVMMTLFAIMPLNEELARRKKLFARMKQINRDNKRLVESAGEGIFSLRNDATCAFINDAALAMLGYKRNEVVGRNIHDLIHHTDPEGTNCAEADCQIIFTLKTAKGVIVEEDLFWRSDGTSFPVTYSSFPLEEGNTHIGVVVVFRDITEQQQKRSVLEHQATHDPLTGLVNRREFERRLERALATAKTEHKEHVLLYMDLDNFKRVNDTAGHNAGDELLRRVARKLTFLMRERDTLARFGGDEFVVLLENCTMPAAMRVACDITDSICGVEFTWDGMSFVIGISIGMVEVGSSCVDVDAIMHAVDGACYMAKQLGGCQVQVWSPEMLMGNKMH